MAKKSTLQLRSDAPTTAIMYLYYLHCLPQLHQLKLYIQFWGVIFLIWQTKMMLLPSLHYVGLCIFLRLFLKLVQVTLCSFAYLCLYCLLLSDIVVIDIIAQTSSMVILPVY